MAYKRGDQVEVASVDEGFLGSYYEATIVTKLRGKEYIVVYKDLLKNDLSGPLREVVTSDTLRPGPPEILATGFELNEKVDAFDNDGWWLGIITGRIGSLYTVYFETTGEKIAYTVDRLRVHQDWINDKWIYSRKRR